MSLYWQSGYPTDGITNGVTQHGHNPITNGVSKEHSDTFDSVIFACHGDEILPILTANPQPSSAGRYHPSDLKKNSGLKATQEEIDILKAFQTTENICYMHSDTTLMPRLKDTWSSWNYMISSQPSKVSHPAGVSLTYNMNILQHIDRSKFGDVLVTMNPEYAPAPSTTQGRFVYTHPLYTVDAVRAQEKLDSIQNKHGVSFCGAWTKYGFHEDGFSSGLKIAIEQYGAKLPFEFEDSTFSRGQAPTMGFADRIVRLLLWVMYLLFSVVERILSVPPIAFSAAIPVAMVAFVFDVLEHYEWVN